MRLAGNRWRHAALPTGPGRSDDEPRTDDESRTDDEARPQTPALSGAVLSNAVKHNPKLIGYAMAPVALPVLLALRHFGLVAHTPIWFYIAVLVAIPALSYPIDRITDGHDEASYINVQVAMHAAAVTTVIYLSGWGREW